MATAKTEDEESYKGDNCDWMAGLPAELHHWPLADIALPGSHNSATFGIKPDAVCSPDAPDTVKSCLSIPFLGEAVRGVCHKWAVCQRLDFTQQLSRGVRYFDLRVCYREDAEDFFFVHSLYGPKLSDMLESVSSFLTSHSKEVVLLDLNHFYCMEEEHHALLLSLIISHFGDVLLSSDSSVRDVTLSDLWENKKQVILFYQHPLACNFSEVWPAASITAPWPNTAVEDECINFLSKTFDEEKPDKFVVCQCILTPNTSNMMNLQGSLDSMVTKFQPTILSWIKNSPSKCRQKLNVVLMDFVESGNIINEVLALNFTHVGVS